MNSLNVRLPHVLDWLTDNPVEVLCLQETKQEDSKFPYEALMTAGYHAIHSGQKTYNGVAIVSNHEMTDLLYGIPNFEDEQKRVISATIGDIRIICVYVVNGQAVDSEKYDYKMRWLDALNAWLSEELKKYPNLVILGDYNIAPDDRDCHDPAAWEGEILVSPRERDAFDDLLAFQAYAFNTENITKNSSAIVAFSNAMDNMPEIDVTRTGGVFGAIAGWFAGDEVMPWDSVKAFGDANINAEGVSANAAAINAMSTSLNTFSVEKLDTTGIVSYTNAMERLVEVLGELNNELSKDNNGYSLGSGTNAGDVLGKMDSIGSGGGAGSDQLNSTMQRVELILTEIRGFEEKVANNTRNISSSNIAAGGVSN